MCILTLLRIISYVQLSTLYSFFVCFFPGTFRDHSWDIRLWAAIDQLFILLLTLERPLIIDGKEFWYLDLTLVHMPNNSGGVQRYTTGWLGTKDAAGKKATGSLRGNLPIIRATSILNVRNFFFLK
jgi:hypothetical protein